MAPKRKRRPRPGRLVMPLIVSQAPVLRPKCALDLPYGLICEPTVRLTGWYSPTRLRVSGFSLESSDGDSVAPMLPKVYCVAAFFTAAMPATHEPQSCYRYVGNS